LIRVIGRLPLTVIGGLFLALLLLTPAVPPLHAQQQVTSPRDFSQHVEEWRRTLDQAQVRLRENELTREQLDALRAKVNRALQAATAARAEADSLRKPLNDQLTALGPAPAKGQPPEPADVAKQRKQLVDQVAQYDARVKQAELTITRATGIGRDIARIGNEQIAQRLLARQPPPLSLPALAAAGHQLGQVLAALADAPAEWWRSSRFTRLEPVNLLWLGLIVLLGLGAGWPLRNWLLRHYGHRSDVTEPSYARRVLAAAVEGLARGLMPAIGLLALAFVLLDEDIVTGLLARMIAGVLFGIIFFSVTAALARAALAPDAPNWRIVPLGAEASRILGRRLTALAGAAAVVLGVGIATHELHPGARELFNLIGLIFDTLIAGLTLTLLERRLWRLEIGVVEEAPKTAPARPGQAETPAPSQWSWPILRLAMGLALIAVPFIALAGYTNLAAHIVTRVVVTGVLVGAILLARTLIRELFTLFIAPESPRSAALRRMLAMTEQGSRILIFWLGAVLDLVLALPGLALLLRLWGVPDSAIGLLAGSILNGFALGNLRLSLGDILLSILVFVAAWTGTRLVQRLLREKLLPQTRLDPGVRHSLSAMVGYVGFIIALALAVSTLGLNLSNIAIIAGALSVGIGFGLQNIVNNFVSGLILLIERPIKVGDWVVVGQHQGYVTRISVRATEVETFERASVIIPNSELLSGAVVNWTHRDKYGRVEVKVGVAYGSDTDKVREILLTCARQHRLLLAWPAPYVLFKDFGDSSLDFELRGYVVDVEQSLHIKSDLHFAIDKAFRAAGIEIPFPQRDVNIRNLEALAKALAAARDSAAAPARSSDPDGDGTARAKPETGAPLKQNPPFTQE
jgi:potassium efflux system protein